MLFNFTRRPKVEGINLGTHLHDVARAVDLELEVPPADWVSSYLARVNAEREADKTAPMVAVHGSIILPTAKNFIFPPTPLVFGPRQPMCFYDGEGGAVYRGQHNAKERIDTRIAAMRPEDRFKCLFTGPAGTGKTTLAWVTAFRIMAKRNMLSQDLGRFFEVLPSQIEDKEQLDAFMRQLLPNDIVFIDEVHILRKAVGAEPLYHVLADTGNPRYPLGQGEGWLELPTSVSWLTATTEPGELDGTTGGALRRRLEPEISLEAPSTDDLAQIVKDQDMPIGHDAAQAIAERSGGLPWQALLVYEEARAIARARQSNTVEDDHVLRAFDTMAIDENGLLPEDRRVLSVLMSVKHTLASGKIVHRMNESALCAAAGVDKSTFKDRVQPKLMRMKYLTTIGGQTLTDNALLDYAHLKDA